MNEPSRIDPRRTAAEDGPGAGWWLACALLVAAQAFFAWGCFNFFVDDPYISLRYARNLAEGHGLVFNIGERVEGFSNLLWVLLLAILHFLGIIEEASDAGVAAKLLSLLSAFGTLALLFRRGAFFAFDAGPGARWLGLAAGALLLTVPGWGLWSVGGLEGPMHALLLLLCCTSSTRFLERSDRRSALVLAATLAATILSRPEGTVHVALVLGTLSLDRSVRGDRRFFPFVVLPAVATALFIIVGRWLYFGELLPNSAVAKTTGIDADLKLRHGYYYTFSGVFPQACLGIALVLALFRVAGSGTPLPIAQRVGWALAFGQSAGCIAGGGDWMPAARYLVPIYPILALLAAGPALAFGERANDPVSRWRLAVPLAAGAMLLGAAYHIALIGMMGGAKPGWEGIEPVERRYRDAAEWIAENIPQEDTLATGDIGYIAYRSRHRIFDCFGLVTPEIAKAPAKGWINSKFDPDAFFGAAPRWVLFAQVAVAPDGSESHPHEYEQQLAADARFGERYEFVPSTEELYAQGWRVYRAR